MSDLRDWFQTPPGQQALAWERARLDEALADVFGYHAVQLGLAGIDALAANRMPHRWLACETLAPERGADEPRPALVTDTRALPFASGAMIVCAGALLMVYAVPFLQLL